MTTEKSLDQNATVIDEPSTSGSHDLKEGLPKAEEKQETNTVPLYKLFYFADSTDKVLMIIGSIGAIGNGLCMPLMTLLFGDLVDSFGQNQSKGVLAVVSKVNEALAPYLVASDMHCSRN